MRGLGLVGYKSYAAKVGDPLYFPVIERLSDLKMIIHLHTNCQLGAGGYRMKYDVGWQYDCNIPEDMVAAAKRYPEATYQYVHIGNGADWEYVCKCIKAFPNIYIDTGGSNNEENMVDFAIRHLGEDRIFWHRQLLSSWRWQDSGLDADRGPETEDFSPRTSGTS